MSVIYRYPLEITGRQTVEVPKGGWFLSAQAYKGAFGVESAPISMWWFVPDPTAKLEQIKIRVIGTGNPFTDKIDHIIPLATVIVGDDPSLVWHIFEEYDE